MIVGVYWPIHYGALTITYNSSLLEYNSSAAAQFTWFHQSHTRTAWLKTVPFGQRNENLTPECRHQCHTCRYSILTMYTTICHEIPTYIPDNGFRCQHNIRAVYRCIEMLVLSARPHRSDSPHPECIQWFAVWTQHFSFELYQTSLSSFLLTAFTAKSYKCATINDVTTTFHRK